ncbi:MAG: NUDIX domain-containing protein [Candidatus Paceibacterota bacterium]
MSNHKDGIASNGELLHYSVGAVIEKDGKYLLIDRVNPPFGFAGLAGHVDEGESEDDAITREVTEESGLKVLSYKLLFEEEILWNYCRGVSRGATAHKWRLYECEVEGEVIHNKEETKSIGWYSIDEIKKMNLEPVWEYWFEKLKII